MHCKLFDKMATSFFADPFLNDQNAYLNPKEEFKENLIEKNHQMTELTQEKKCEDATESEQVFENSVDAIDYLEANKNETDEDEDEPEGYKLYLDFEE